MTAKHFLSNLKLPFNIIIIIQFITLGTRCQSALIELKLSRWHFSPSSLAFVTLLCGNIETLDLSFSRATDEHIRIITKNCPRLEHLNVQDEEQKITDNGLKLIANASFNLKSLNLTGRNYAVDGILNLLVRQQKLTHLRIGNLIEAIHLYAAKYAVTQQSLKLSHLVLLEVGSNLDNLSLSVQLDFSLIVPYVTALEIDLSLFRKMMDRDSVNLFGLPTLTSLKELKVRETIGTGRNRQNQRNRDADDEENEEYERFRESWNSILALPSFRNITFLQLESGLRPAPIPDVSRQGCLRRLIIRNSTVVFEDPRRVTNHTQVIRRPEKVPKLPSQLSELIISKIKSGLEFEKLKEMLSQLSFVECLCLHFSSDAEVIKTSKEWICCMAHILPHVKRLHISGNRNWEVDSDFLDYILKNANHLVDLQINHLKLTAMDRQLWLDHVSSTYAMKFKLLE